MFRNRIIRKEKLANLIYQTFSTRILLENTLLKASAIGDFLIFFFIFFNALNDIIMNMDFDNLKIF